jgi:hypothetical protein
MTRLLYILPALKLSWLVAAGALRNASRLRTELGYWLANSGSLPRVGFVEFTTIARYPAHTVLLVTSDRPVA